MKYFKLFLFTILLQQGLSQSTKVQINTTFTENHLFIPTTKLSIIPPDGFDLSKTFIGFKNGKSSIQFMEQEGGCFNIITSNLNREYLTSQGKKVIGFEKVTVNQLDGYLLSFEQEQTTTQLIFGNSTYCATLTGTYPNDDKIIKLEIDKSIKSIFLDSTRIASPLEFAEFDIDLSLTNLKFIRLGANQFVFNTDNLQNAYFHPEGATLEISQIPTDLKEDSIKDFVTSEYEKMSNFFQGLEILEKGDIFIDEQESYYILSNTKFNDIDLYYFTALITTEDVSFLINAGSFSGRNHNFNNLILAVQQMKIKGNAH